jgi:hypothetical protein
MRAQGSVTAQRPHRLAQPLRRVTPSRPAAGVGQVFRRQATRRPLDQAVSTGSPSGDGSPSIWC